MFRHKKIEPHLLLFVLFLLAISSVVVFSVYQENILNHIIYIFIGIVFFLLFYYLDFEIIFPFSNILYFISALSLTLPFILGTVTRGSVRWIPIGRFTIQPSEIVKPFFILMSANYWSKRNFSYRNLALYILYLLPVLLLIFKQPDLGSTLVIISIFCGIVLFSGILARQLVLILFIVILIFPFSWFVLEDYQKTRAMHFLNPYSDPLGEGYNVIQSKIAIGSGGLWGKGFGKGTQSHLSFLPERHTDFIFASASEEFGFSGGLSIVVVYLLLLQKIIVISRCVKEKKLLLLCMGIFFYFFFQITVNIGMNIGIMPITGITLPFMSYGGTSMLVSMICLGMVENVYRSNFQDQYLLIK